MARKRKSNNPAPPKTTSTSGSACVRIVGGHYRGRKLRYAGDPRVRPMKDRLREAVFNLVGPEIKGKHALDLFAGTGAIGLEAISRGAATATLIERHFPTAKVVQQNIETLGCSDQVTLTIADSFVWSQTSLLVEQQPWAVFCCPPYAFFRDRWEDMESLIERILDAAPGGSVMCVEAEIDFNTTLLPRAEQWDAREYPPAIVAILRKPMSAVLGTNAH